MLPGLLFFSEHSLAGAGRIYQYLVKESRQAGSQMRRRFIGYDGVGKAHALYILRKLSAALRMDFVGKQKAVNSNEGCNLCAFAAWRRTKIQYAIANPGRQQRNRRHGAGILQIIYARFMVGMLAWSLGRIFHIKPLGAPRYRGQRQSAVREKSVCTRFA